ncbi:small ribosomal subunit protein mS47 isoform X1 [Nicotiana tabacum]|uniref:3-hydroxyisobutyryl-CoA hydrolase n=1 Tax=Nicotiana tabacum TaxID=4097 RepID=A0A1S4B518_TOBAC|nr:PREDICTED: 3-hydroxyisobutyryl-CoA hydrolase-like protein 2, mitochondrial isoform X1 [Nicotiana tabacum]
MRMNKLKVLLSLTQPLRRNDSRFLSNHHCRHFSAQPSYAHVDYIQEQVLVEGRAKSRAAILNRPSALNAITPSMAARLSRLYESWEENSDIGFVMMKGNGRAFSSGADVVTLYELINEGKIEECKKFFETLYKFVYLLGTYLKPNVAILDGVTMGSGAGISLPGMFRVVTDRTVRTFSNGAFLYLAKDVVYSTPEAQIGFHPDAGASYYLSRLPGYLGEYLALTGEKLNGVEMIACGLATHYSLKERLPWLEERLGKLITDDRLVIENSLAQYGDLVYPDSKSVLHKFEKIDKCFSQDTVEEIIEALEREAAESHDEWCNTALNKIKEASPLSLKVALKSIREGRFQPLDQCLVREYRISINWVSKRVSDDFCEGVRARLVDKDFAPKWGPTRLEEVTTDMVDCFFIPLGELEPELNLATALREPSM